jgi:hypothetical protein
MNEDLIGKGGFITVNSWAGRHRVKVTIVGVTPKRYRVRLEQDALMPGGRHMKAGDVTLVPRDVVQLEASRG